MSSCIEYRCFGRKYEFVFVKFLTGIHLFKKTKASHFCWGSYSFLLVNFTHINAAWKMLAILSQPQCVKDKIALCANYLFLKGYGQN